MPDAGPRFQSLLTGLSARLLVLTVAFVMLSELLIWAPSVANYRKVYLEEHIAKAHLAALHWSVEGMPYSDIIVTDGPERDLLYVADAYSISVKQPGSSPMILRVAAAPEADLVLYLEQGNALGWLGDAFSTLLQRENRILRVIGTPPKNPTLTIAMTIDEKPLRDGMWAYSERIFELSIVISLITAGLVFLSLQWLMVRPMRRVTASMTAFREAPEDVSRTIEPSHRSDEIGIAQRELAVMQDELREALHQKSRLATLGAAVAKVNHDLRNTLATAMLMSDRLSDIDDPEVKKVAPRLYDAMDRAVNLCSQTLNYIGEAAPKPRVKPMRLDELVDEVGNALCPRGVGEGDREWRNRVSPGTEIDADRDLLFRVLSNLGQNAFQAGAGEVRVEAEKGGNGVSVTVADNGPGISEPALGRLFKPFAGSSRDGGSGLGLVICREIMQAHGGEVTLLATGEAGTTFRLRLPPSR